MVPSTELEFLLFKLFSKTLDFNGRVLLNLLPNLPHPFTEQEKED